MTPDLTIGATVGETTARENRERIEAAMLAAARDGWAVDLPAGEIVLDRALAVASRHSGVTLRGASSRATPTVLRNGFAHDRTLRVGDSAEATGLGPWDVDVAAWSSGRTNVLAVLTPGVALAAGSWCHVHQRDGYLPQFGGQQHCSLARVVAVDGNRVTLSASVHPAANKLAAYGGGSRPCGTVADGTAAVAPPAYPASGEIVFVSSGPSVGNELTGEYRRLVAPTPNGLWSLDRALRRSLADAVVVPVTVPTGVVVEDVTLAPPPHPLLEPLFVKYAVGLTFRRCRFEAAAAPPMLVSCAHVAFEDCRSNHRLNVGASHDVAIRGGTWGGLNLEEACTDIAAVGVTFAPPAWHGVSADGLYHRGLRIDGCTVAGVGAMANPANPDAGRFSPLFLGGVRDLSLRGVEIAGTAPGVGSRVVRCDDLLAVACRSDAPLGVEDCTRSRIVGWLGPAGEGSIVAEGGRGVCVGCTHVKAAPEWRVV